MRLHAFSCVLSSPPSSDRSDRSSPTHATATRMFVPPLLLLHASSTRHQCHARGHLRWLQCITALILTPTSKALILGFYKAGQAPLPVTKRKLVHPLPKPWPEDADLLGKRPSMTTRPPHLRSALPHNVHSPLFASTAASPSSG
jgi:hypothetical protein